MRTFGIIAEGPTDQIIIENILIGFFNNADLSATIRFLQPLRDTTDQATINRFGGWYKVFEFCQSQNFVGAFEQNDYVIIQIDTDACGEEHYDVKRQRSDGSKLTCEELINAVIKKFELLFINSFGNEKFDAFKDRVIYAISVEEIECWILPLYYEDKISSATTSCIKRLNKRIFDQFGFYIDEENKSNQGKNYEKMTRDFMKKKVLMKKYNQNPSLKVFIDSLIVRNIDIGEE